MLKASKREAGSKTDCPMRHLEDYQVDRPEVKAQQCVQLTGTNQSNGLTTFSLGVLAVSHTRLFCLQAVSRCPYLAGNTRSHSEHGR